jgi:UDP-glucose 4-epimerase
VRDYIHVMDLAEGHVAAIDYLEQAGGLLTVNLGTGKGTTVLEMICAFARASGRSIPYQIVGRRPGDIAQCYADPKKANLILGWHAKRNIDRMCADAWRRQQANTTGVE